MDGTLLDSFHVFVSVIGEMAPVCGFKAPDESYIRHHYHGSLNDTLSDILHVNGDRLNELTEQFVERQQKHYEHPDSDLYADAVRLAKRAHEAGVLQIVVSNRDHYGRGNASARTIVEDSTLAPYIDRVICGDDVTFRKPDARAVESVVDVDHSSTLVVGDQFVDGQLAMNLDAKAVLVCRDGGTVPHLERLGVGWEDHIRIVASLDEVDL